MFSTANHVFFQYTHTFAHRHFISRLNFTYTVLLGRWFSKFSLFKWRLQNLTPVLIFAFNFIKYKSILQMTSLKMYYLWFLKFAFYIVGTPPYQQCCHNSDELSLNIQSLATSTLEIKWTCQTQILWQWHTAFKQVESLSISP